MFWLFFAITVAILGYYWLKHYYSYWTRLGVPQGKPVPFLGDISGMIFRTKSPTELTDYIYDYSLNSRYVGAYQFFTKSLILRDPELIKQITVKDFDHFLDHNGFVQGDADVLLSKNLFALTGQRWREMRSTLSPSFTSSKMKHLFSLMSQTGEQFVEHFKEKNEKIITVEMKELLSKFANDVISNTVFGFKCDTLKEPKNEFFVHTEEATNFRTLRVLFVFLGYIIVPKICNFLGLKLATDKVTNFFNRIVKENIESREKHGIVRPDMISLLLEARKNNPKEEDPTLPDTGFATVEESEIGKNQKFRLTKITDEDITAQAFIFLFAGFDTVSTVLSFMAYELAINPEVQERLHQEVEQVREKCGGKITYEAITTMKYMDMVVSESLRKYPSAISVDRVCTKPYTITPKNPHEKPIHLKKGDVVFIPMWAIQRDPKYWSEPDRFDPERFNEENKHKIVPYSYLPFGAGPRSCIGSRFALLEIKIFFYYLLASFELVPVEKTQVPIRYDRKALSLTAEKGLWVGLQRRG